MLVLVCRSATVLALNQGQRIASLPIREQRWDRARVANDHETLLFFALQFPFLPDALVG